MKLTTILALLVFSAVAAGALAGDEPAAAAPTLAEMEGIDIYRNVCKSCHGPDADAGAYTPMDLIMEQWDEFFQDTFVETHKDLDCPKCAGPDGKAHKITDAIEGDVLKKVQKFCVDHAADSEQPMTCG